MNISLQCVLSFLTTLPLLAELCAAELNLDGWRNATHAPPPSLRRKSLFENEKD
jgi:hypothetical protein